MIEGRWGIPARGASIDRDSTAVTIFSILEGITAEALPLFMQHITVVFALSRESSDPEQIETVIHITRDGKDLLTTPLAVDFQQGLRTYAIVNFNGLLITAPGEMEFSIAFEGRELTHASLVVSGPRAIKPEVTFAGGKSLTS